MKKRILPVIALLSIIALSAGAYPPPSDDKMLLTELEQKMFDYDGKIVEVEITYCRNFKQLSSDEYSAYCSCRNATGWGYATVYFSKNEDAVEFFEDLAEKSYGSSNTSVFVLVDGEKFIAIGERFSKSKGIYKW